MKEIDSDELGNIITLEANLSGDIYEISCARDLSMGGFENGINTISMKIAFMEKVAAATFLEFDNMKAELTVLEAEIDEKVRAIRGMRGEQRILRCIQRDPRWLRKKLSVNEANANYLTAKGIVDAYKTFASMLEIKSNNMRKFPELRESKAFFTKKRFFIKKRLEFREEESGRIKEKLEKRRKKIRRMKKTKTQTQEEE